MKDRNKTKILLDILLRDCKSSDYIDQYKYVMDLVAGGIIEPVKNSGLNGRKPALYNAYWKIIIKKNYDAEKMELMFSTDTRIDNSYYLDHLSEYEADRKYVRQLNDYLRNHSDRLSVKISRNERSFEIWNREKYLSKEGGRTLLSRCGLTESFLNYYETAEPFAYYAATRDVPQNILIIENSDTFFSIRKHLMDGGQGILGTSIGTVIYGSGNGGTKQFREFNISAEPYMKAIGNKIYYFGDMDYEGIGIYERIRKEMAPDYDVVPFKKAYLRMLQKAVGQTLPPTKDRQRETDGSEFFSYFEEEDVCQMKSILLQGLYIPQEILNVTDFKEDSLCHMN